MCTGGDTIKSARILVIEKDEALAVKETAALEEAGYSVVRVTDVLDGLKKLYEAYPDLIIVAQESPIVNDEDACLRIRQASYLPIIVLGSEEEEVETLELGVDAYITKPPSLSELVARVHSLLRRKRRDYPPADSSKPYIENRPPNEGNGFNKLFSYMSLYIRQHKANLPTKLSVARTGLPAGMGVMPAKRGS